MKIILSILATILYILPVAAMAQVTKSGGFSEGIVHPALGLDHMLAMISVGIISTQIGGKVVWTLPATFVLIMVIGGLMGMYGVYFTEPAIGIAVSVIILGFVIAQDTRLAVGNIFGLVAIFAIFHGYAHGLEIPYLALSWLYVGGFMTGTAILHIIGVLIGYAAGKVENGYTILSYSGAVVAGIGLHMLMNLVEKVYIL